MAKCSFDGRQLKIHEIVAHNITDNLDTIIKTLQDEKFITPHSELILFVYQVGTHETEANLQEVRADFLKMTLDAY